MTAAPDVQTPGWCLANARTKAESGPIIGDDLSADNSFRSLQKEFARLGHELVRTHPADGPVSYYVTRWGMVRQLGSNLNAAREFLQRVGGKA